MLISFSKPSKALHVIFIDLLLLHTLNNKPCPWQRIFQFIMKLNDFKMHIWLFFASLLNIVWDWSQVLVCEWLLFYSFCRPRTLMGMSFVILLLFYWVFTVHLSEPFNEELRVWPVGLRITNVMLVDKLDCQIIYIVTRPLDVVNSNHSLRKTCA